VIVGWTTSSGSAYCTRHKRGEEPRPIFSTDEGWRDVVCEVLDARKVQTFARELRPVGLTLRTRREEDGDMPENFEVVCDATNNSQEDLDKGILRATVRVLARALVGRTAGELRRGGFDVDANVPDCSVLELGPDGRPVFNWVTISFTVNRPAPGFRQEIFEEGRELHTNFDLDRFEDPIR
jgi:hypothetical protein